MFCDRPMISVVMGVQYRRQDLRFLERSVQSILEQTYSNLEFLICENKSTLQARQYLKNLEMADSRVHLIDGGTADTLAAKLNRCIQAAKGDYIARQDDDDSSNPKRLEAQWSYLNTHPEIAFVGCVARLERDGVDAGLRLLPQKPVIKDFLFVQPFLHPTLLFRRNIFSVCGNYCEKIRCSGCEDYDLLLRIYEAGYVGANIQNPYFTYTLPPMGTSNRSFRMRCNEVATRFIRFRSLGLLPGALQYVIKPVAVGLIPQRYLEKIKERDCRHG